MYTNRSVNLSLMDKFLEKHNVARVNPKEYKNVNRPVTDNKIESVIKNIPRKNKPKPYDFTSKFYQTFKKYLLPILLKLFPKIEENTFSLIL